MPVDIRVSQVRLTPTGRVSRYAVTATLFALAVATPAAGQSVGFAIDPPAGWPSVVDPGSARATLARDSADLEADVPAGPRIRVSRGDSAPPAPEPGIDRVVEDPTETTLGGRSAVSIGLESATPAGAVRRRVIVSSANGTSWRVDLEAPASEWITSIETMEAAVRGIRVAGPGSVALGTAAVAGAEGGPSAVALPILGGGGGVRPGRDRAAIAIGALALVALGLLGALLIARRGGLGAGRVAALDLEIVGPDGRASRTSVRSLPAVIGREPGCDVVLSDPEASRRHARVSRGTDGLVVEDLGSVAGTRVDGRPVHRIEIGSGSEITLGRTRIRIR